jgi:hypothetical protein
LIFHLILSAQKSLRLLPPMISASDGKTPFALSQIELTPDLIPAQRLFYVTEEKRLHGLFSSAWRFALRLHHRVTSTDPEATARTPQGANGFIQKISPLYC